MGMIEIGDVVQVNKDDACMNWIKRAEVIQMPRGEGDLWGFRDLDTSTEIFTNEKFTIYKRQTP
jgi:putative protein kinase ArgK-like GTPase of G3E family